MLSKEKLARINELSKLSKERELTNEELKEQTELRKEYLDTFRSSMRQTIENVRVVDEEGEDITPEKIKDIQKNKKLH